MKYARVPLRRLEAWLDAVYMVEEFAVDASDKLGRATIILHGSYARGDFNLWSDIDLIVISQRFRGIRILDRLDIIRDIIRPGIEPVTLTVDEAFNVLVKASWRLALKRGSYVVRDDYNLKNRLEEALGFSLPYISELKSRIESLKSML